MGIPACFSIFESLAESSDASTKNRGWQTSNEINKSSDMIFMTPP
jgi:hypothetical protein